MSKKSMRKRLRRIEKALDQAYMAKAARQKAGGRMRPAAAKPAARGVHRPAPRLSFAEQAALAKAAERTAMIRGAWETLARQGAHGAGAQGAVAFLGRELGRSEADITAQAVSR